MFDVVSGNIQRNWMKDCEFVLIRHPNELFDAATKATKEWGHDFETNTLNAEKARIVGYSCAYDGYHGFYYPVSHVVGAELNLPIGPLQEVIKGLDKRATYTEAASLRFSNVWYNYGGFDGEVMLNNWGWEMKHWEDCYIAIFLANSNMTQYGLKETSMRELGIEMITFEEVTQGRTFDLLHPEDENTINYAASDACVELRLWNLPKVKQALLPGNLHELGQEWIYNLEKQVAVVLREGMNYKVWCDLEKLELLHKDCQRRISAVEQEIYELAGGPFNVASPVELGNKLVEIGVPITETTGKSHQISTREETLEKYKKDHKIIPLVLQRKKLFTQDNNYILKLINTVNHFGPAVRFAFQHVGVPTGRMKCGGSGKGDIAFQKGVADVNVQSLPDHKKEEYLPNIRSAIVANDPRTDSKEWAIVDIDYSQVELRIAGNLSRERTWIEEFSKPNSDIHKKNAELAYRRKIDKSTREGSALRDRGKTISFAILYGGDEYTVSNNAGISIEQGKILVESFFAGARELKAWIDGWIKAARIRKMVKTYFGRVRHLNEFYVTKEQVPDARQRARLAAKGDREAVNDPIQGGAADIFKIACVKVARLLKEKGWQNDCHHILYMHDAIIFRMRVSMMEQIIPAIQKEMEFEVKYWPIRLTTDVEAGWNWGETKPLAKFLEEVKSGVAYVKPTDETDSLTSEEAEFEAEMAEARRDYGHANRS